MKQGICLGSVFRSQNDIAHSCSGCAMWKSVPISNGLPDLTRHYKTMTFVLNHYIDEDFFHGQAQEIEFGSMIDGKDASVRERIAEVGRKLSHMKKASSMPEAKCQQQVQQDKEKSILIRHLHEKNLGPEVFDKVEDDFLRFRLWEDTKVIVQLVDSLDLTMGRSG
eukprot:751537-Hanusia_phi.AAC.1